VNVLLYSLIEGDNMSRITDKDLNNLVARINQALGKPEEYYKDGKAQVGNYHIYSAYNSVSLVCTINESGGVVTIFGLTTKRELYTQMSAFLSGIHTR
jgi:hypothetical protein